jgi:hypothetical protein
VRDIDTYIAAESLSAALNDLQTSSGEKKLPAVVDTAPPGPPDRRRHGHRCRSHLRQPLGTLAGGSDPSRLE